MSAEIVLAVLIFSLSLVFFGFLAFLRYMRYREVVLLAEKGLLGIEKANKNGHDSLRWGAVLTALGAALCLGMYPLGFIGPESFPLRFGPWMLIGLLPMFFGLALLFLYYAQKREEHCSGVEARDEENALDTQERR